MKSAFRVVCSKGASFLTKKERVEIVNEAVARAEKINAREACYIFNGGQDLKIVVRMIKREVWIMTNGEADAGGLPSPSHN